MRTLLLLLVAAPALGQRLQGPALDYAFPREYTIGGITVTGCVTREPNAVKLFSGLKVGDKVNVPGQKITDAIKNIWDQQLFSDVRIEAAEVRGQTIFLNITVKEVPQLSFFKFTNVSKSESEKLRDELTLARGQQVTEAAVKDARETIRRYYVDKGYLKARVATREVGSDSLMPNSVILYYDVERGPKVKIAEVNFFGNEHVESSRLRKAMRKTKRKTWYNIFASSKFSSKEYEADKRAVIDVFNDNGYRNASIVKDSVYYVKDDRLAVDIHIDEDRRFYYRNVSFTGNTKYTSDTLTKVLAIKRGDVYNKKRLESRLYMNQSGQDVSSLYMDKGYLSFSPQPVEVVDGDSIDLEIRVREGKQYRIRNVSIKGNTKTYDHVIRREIRTKPGQLFDRSEVIRSQQQLIGLGYFDPEATTVNPSPDPRTGLVDLEYIVAEKPSDRLELSGGYGAGRLVLTLGLSFTNFSMRKFFKPGAWTPLPAGDGQTLNLRAQTNGRAFQTYSVSFIEPWLGGRKPNSFSLSGWHSVQTNGADKYINTSEGRISNPLYQSLRIYGLSVGFGKRIPWPDDYFSMSNTVSYQLYDLNNWISAQATFGFPNGKSNVLAYQFRLTRRSIFAPFWNTQGSDITFSVKLTPPWSLWGWTNTFPEGEDIATLEPAEKYKWAEFHKWKFTTQWFVPITRPAAGGSPDRRLVLMARAGFGFLGKYNTLVGNSPFERFYLGGSALTGFQLDGREIVALRGYDDLSLSPSSGSFLINKYTAELRYPISLNPQATIFALTFMEAGKTWQSFERYDPFNLYRSAGIGLRLFLPMFGPMGLDYGWRFDDVPTRPAMARGQFHFTIGIDLGEL
ncbi:MAG: outer membrane protein assembly factor BamA [Flavobacteriales bacterium]|nr:outer membrane protein assembly factor BamA [Flavobacteriales bacterium]